MQELRRYVRSRWGGADLGILAKPPRAVRAGDTPSLHNWGIAWDWRWQDPGPGRQAADAVIEFCLGNAEALGVQAVHDYQGTRFWKSFSGWQTGKPNPKTGMGQPWAQWLHIERTWQSANQATSIEALLGSVGTGAPADTAPRRRHRRHHPTPSTNSEHSCPPGRCGAAAAAPTSGDCRTSCASSASPNSLVAMASSGRARRRR